MNGERQVSNADRPPDTVVLYGMADIAMRAWVPVSRVSQLVREGKMPPHWLIQGRKYWTRASLAEAVAAARDGPDQNAA